MIYRVQARWGKPVVRIEKKDKVTATAVIKYAKRVGAVQENGMFLIAFEGSRYQSYPFTEEDIRKSLPKREPCQDVVIHGEAALALLPKGGDDYIFSHLICP